MCLNNNLKKDCSFYVSDFHLLAMILPYINKELNEGKKVVTILEQDLQNEMEILISKMNLKEETKNKIMNINWYKAKEDINNIEENTDIIVVGDKKYIDNANEKIRANTSKSANAKIINCYEVFEFNNNIDEILNYHDKILNTSGEKEINEIFEGYEKKKIHYGN